MGVLTWLTLIGSVLSSLPMLLWLVGVQAWVMPMLHLFAAVLCLRLLYLTARIAARRADVMWVGGFFGTSGSLVSQLFLHLPRATANLAAAYAPYGHLGADMYRLAALSLWWPFALTLWSGVAYAVLGALMFRLARRGPSASTSQNF